MRFMHRIGLLLAIIGIGILLHIEYPDIIIGSIFSGIGIALFLFSEEK